MSLVKKEVLSQFAQDTIEGLGSHPKTISSKYFYDTEGDKIFQQIMAMPEYYLTRSEFEIFEHQGKEIATTMTKGSENFNLIEFGAGDGYKTKLLLQQLLNTGVGFTYYPVDISKNILQELEKELKAEFPQLEVSPLNLDYFEALKTLSKLNTNKNITLFLGSNIGNFHDHEARQFLDQFKHQCRPGDRLLLGVDLKKDPRIITLAYDDPHGITAAFNLNLLKRMNRELGAHFQLDNFSHHTFYEPISGEVFSYLVSLKEQNVSFDTLDLPISFEAYEMIHTEISKKYSIRELDVMASDLGFAVQKHFTDTNHYFVDSLWEIKA